MKCDGTRAEIRFRLSAKGTSPFKSAGATVQSTTGSRGVRISGSNAGYTMFRGSVKGTGYPFHSPVSPSLPLPCVTVCHHISIGVYDWTDHQGMTPFRKMGEGGSLQQWNDGVNILNKQSRTAENRWYTSLGVERGVDTLSL